MNRGDQVEEAEVGWSTWGEWDKLLVSPWG